MQMLDRLGAAAGAGRIFRREMQEAKKTLRIISRRLADAPPQDQSPPADLANLLGTEEISPANNKARKAKK